MDIKSAKQLEEASQSASNFVEINDGEKVTLRIVSGIKGVKEHNLEIKGKDRSIICPEAMEEWEAQTEDREVNQAIKCPVCASPNMKDRKVSTRFASIAIDENGKVGVLKKGPSVYKTVMNLIEEGYDLSETPIVISRKGTKLDTEYAVLPSRKDAPLTDNEKQAIEKFKEGYDIDQYTTPMSYENIERKLRGEAPVFDDAKAEIDPDQLPFK